MNIFERLPVNKLRSILSDAKPVLPDEVLSLIYKNRLFKIFVPEALGGLQLSLPQAFSVLADCAYVDGDFGWCVQIGAGGGYFTEFLSAEIARDFISKPEFVIAGSGFPGGVAIAENGGYHIKNGHWKYCSGSQYATLFTANCKLGTSEEILAFAFLLNHVKIIPAWNGYGIQASSSHNMEINGLFLDAKMSFRLDKPLVDYEYPLHRYPFLSFAEVVIYATLHGCFRHLTEETETILLKNNSILLKNEWQKAQNLAENLWHKMEDLVFESWDIAINKTEESKREVFDRLSCEVKNSTRLLYDAATSLFFQCGMQSTYQHQPFNKCWRDFTTICQHSLLKQHSTQPQYHAGNYPDTTRRQNITSHSC